MRYLLPLIALAIALGCRGAGGDSAAGAAPLAPTVRVEDGVTVLEHPPDAFARAPRVTVDGEPLATMGGASGDPAYDLTWAQQALLLADGRVLTLARIGARIMLFGVDGSGEWLYARRGRGPGDLMAPSALIAAGGDTILVPDRANQRVNLLIPGRGIVGQMPLEPDAQHHPGEMAGVLPGPEFVMHAAGWSGGEPPSDTAIRKAIPLFVANAATGAMREIASVRDLEMVPFETRFGGRRLVRLMRLRLGKTAQIAVWDTLIAIGNGDGYQIELRNREGAVVRRLVVPVPARPVTEAVRDAQIALELERFENQQGERMIDPAESKRMVYEHPFADTLPPYSAFFVTRDQTLWVLDYIAPNDTSWSATAIDRSGAIIGRLTMPGRTRPVAFANDRVVVRGEDHDGVVFLRVLRLRGID